MADPVSFKMFAPTVPQQDLSPIVEGMRIDAQASLATQQGIVAGFAQERDIQAKAQTVEQAQKEKQKKLDHLEQVMTELSDPQGFQVDTVEDWRNDPDLVGSPDAVAAKKMKVERLMSGANPLSYTDALAQAETLVQPRYVRYVKPEKAAAMRAKLATAQIYWNDVGGGEGGFEKFVNLTAGQDAFLTAEEAYAASSKRYTESLRGADAGRRELATMQISAEQKAQEKQIAAAKELSDQNFQQQLEIARQAEGMRAEQETTAFGREKIMAQFKARIADALNKGNTAEAIKIQEAASRFDFERQSALQKQSADTQLKLQENELSAAAAIAAAKQHEFTPAEQDTALNLGQTIKQVSGNASVPLAAVAGAARSGALGDFVEQFTKVATTTAPNFFGTPGSKVKQIDLSRFAVAIDANGQVKLSDNGGPDGKQLDQKTLDKISRSIFRNDQTRFAVAMSQAYGGLFETGSDLEITYRVAQRTGMDQLLLTRLALLAGGGATSPAAPAPAAAGVDPLTGRPLIRHQ